MYYCKVCSNSPLIEYDATRLQCPNCKKLYSNPNPQPKLEAFSDPLIEETNHEIDEHIIDTNLEEVVEDILSRKKIIEQLKKEGSLL